MSGRQGSNLMLAACLAMLSYVPFQVGRFIHENVMTVVLCEDDL